MAAIECTEKYGYVHRLKPGAQGKPILFVFHGTGGDENQFHEFGAGLMPEATIVSPRGDVSEYGAARFFKRTGEGVYDMADLARATGKMAGFIRAMKEAKDASEVAALGYSNGANILANVLFEHPDLVDRAVLMHPLIPFTPGPQPGLKGRKVLITAGQRDPICPAPLTLSLAEYLNRQGAGVTVEWHAGGHDVRSTEIEAIGRFLAA
jgi:phospholipase/carboxylesterase